MCDWCAVPRPERVTVGRDMVLHCGFTLSTDQARPSFRRQRSKFTKDLAGIIFEEAMQELLMDDFLKQFRYICSQATHTHTRLC